MIISFWKFHMNSTDFKLRFRFFYATVA